MKAILCMVMETSPADTASGSPLEPPPRSSAFRTASDVARAGAAAPSSSGATPPEQPTTATTDGSSVAVTTATPDAPALVAAVQLTDEQRRRIAANKAAAEAKRAAAAEAATAATAGWITSDGTIVSSRAKAARGAASSGGGAAPWTTDDDADHPRPDAERAARVVQGAFPERARVVVVVTPKTTPNHPTPAPRGRVVVAPLDRDVWLERPRRAVDPPRAVVRGRRGAAARVLGDVRLRRGVALARSLAPRGWR